LSFWFPLTPAAPPLSMRVPDDLVALRANQLQEAVPISQHAFEVIT
jgi:hypothetical protein